MNSYDYDDIYQPELGIDSMDDDHYSDLLKLAVEEATDLANDPKLLEDEDEFHRQLFGRVLDIVDGNEAYKHLNIYNATAISLVCGEVEGDVIHGDILGL